jgi:hypothetical protein
MPARRRQQPTLEQQWLDRCVRVDSGRAVFQALPVGEPCFRLSLVSKDEPLARLQSAETWVREHKAFHLQREAQELERLRMELSSNLHNLLPSHTRSELEELIILCSEIDLRRVGDYSKSTAKLLVRTWPHLDSLLSSGVRMVPRYLVDELRKEQHVEPAVVSSIMTADGWLALMSVAKYRLFSAAKYRLFSADDVCARS